MALTMLDKQAEKSRQSAWPADHRRRIRAREQQSQSLRRQRAGVGDRTRAGLDHPARSPASAIGFHRHVLDYFWTSVTGGRGRQHVHDGTTVEYTYAARRDPARDLRPGQFKVHDLENLGDKEMVFMTIEFLHSANKPMPLPDGVRQQAAA